MSDLPKVGEPRYENDEPRTYLGFNPEEDDRLIYYDHTARPHKAETISVAYSDHGEPILSVRYVQDGTTVIVRDVYPAYSPDGALTNPARSWEPVASFDLPVENFSEEAYAAVDVDEVADMIRAKAAMEPDDPRRPGIVAALAAATLPRRVIFSETGGVEYAPEPADDRVSDDAIIGAAHTIEDAVDEMRRGRVTFPYADTSRNPEAFAALGEAAAKRFESEGDDGESFFDPDDTGTDGESV